MIITNLHLKNWRNFRDGDAQLRERMFVVGPNASGKSNLLDALRFLRDVAKSGGGLQHAVNVRGGMSKIRCLAARRSTNVEISIAVGEPQAKESWRYEIGIKQNHLGPILTHETVWKAGEVILERPKPEDQEDPERLTQTHLEQIQANQKFRELQKFLDSIRYLHLVPQLLRHPTQYLSLSKDEDYFGRDFLDVIARTPEKTRNARLRKIEEALKNAVPQMQQLELVRDDSGLPHLQVMYQHWRPNAAKQWEDQFSDGTLRMIGLFWSLLDGESPLLLEEPELSLHQEIVSKLPSLIAKLQRKGGRQVILTTHSQQMLSDPGIGGEEVLELRPSKEGTSIRLLSSDEQAQPLLAAGIAAGEIVITRTRPQGADQLTLF